MTLHLNGLLLYERGAPVDFDPEAASKSIAADRDTSIVLLLEEGKRVGPLLDDRSHGRIRAAERGLSHVVRSRAEGRESERVAFKIDFHFAAAAGRKLPLRECRWP